MLRFVDAVKAACERCPPFQSDQHCAVIVREPSGTRETLCLTHTLARVADLMLAVIVARKEEV